VIGYNLIESDSPREAVYPTNKHHLALGRAVDAWSKVEGSVWFVFSMLSRTEIDVGYAIMASFSGFGPQLDLFERMIKMQRMEPELRAALTDARKEYARLTPQRNKIIHGEWFTKGQGRKRKTVRMGKTKDMRYVNSYSAFGHDPKNAVFTIEMIERFTDDCKALYDKMGDLIENPQLNKRFPIIL
jgi:hypothetical protein